MKKLLGISVLILLWFGNSFALSPEFEKEIYNNCYQDAKLSLGAKRAKQYCTCTTKMLDNKYSDEDILNDPRHLYFNVLTGDFQFYQKNKVELVIKKIQGH